MGRRHKGVAATLESVVDKRPSVHWCKGLGGWYCHDQESPLKFVFLAKAGARFHVLAAASHAELAMENPLSQVLPALKCLGALEDLTKPQNVDGTMWALFGRMRRVRITLFTRGPKKRKLWLFYGRLGQLNWNPGRLHWKHMNKVVSFMDFSTNIGRDLMKQRHVVANPVEANWQGMLPLTHRMRWNSVWAKSQTKKEVGLMWLIWHRVVVVNA